MMIWMAFGAALGMTVGTLINDFEIGLSLGMGISAICCGGDLVQKALRNKRPMRLSWFD